MNPWICPNAHGHAATWMVNVHYNVTDDVSRATGSGRHGHLETASTVPRSRATTVIARFNGWTDGEYGGNHAYSFNIRSYPTGDLQSGTNTITFFSSNILHHGIEILWPGPGLIVRYGGSAGNFGPSISSHPANRSVALGATASFSVGASACPRSGIGGRRTMPTSMGRPARFHHPGNQLR
ncbi:MAG: hypothetical protein IPI01_20765 [Ignavibacteriae bacterium]|nr:hypothetical protein [Ignavibacteriota bacterium]